MMVAERIGTSLRDGRDLLAVEKPRLNWHVLYW
jgi:hypothetical protein